jgi:hypothetical protein
MRETFAVGLISCKTEAKAQSGLFGCQLALTLAEFYSEHIMSFHRYVVVEMWGGEDEVVEHCYICLSWVRN